MRRAYANAAQEARYEIKQIAELERREDERDRAFKEDVEGGGFSESVDALTKAEEIEDERLLSQARRLGVEIPSLSDASSWTSMKARPFVMTEAARNTLRANVRAAQRERRESLLKLVGALTPLAALLVALASIINTCHTRSH
jgi:hypothetical protein